MEGFLTFLFVFDGINGVFWEVWDNLDHCDLRNHLRLLIQFLVIQMIVIIKKKRKDQLEQRMVLSNPESRI